MLPRRPTRLELTQDDMQEYERMKAERKAYEEELLAAAVQQGATTGQGRADPLTRFEPQQTRARSAAERIGLIRK
jgi:hypothetical protein